jgi:hypothetical protein
MADNMVLLDAQLVPDPDSTLEMGVTRAELLTDEDIAGSRILIVKRKRGLKKPRDGDRAMTEIECTFHPAPTTRFVSARVTVKILAPQDATFLGVAPTIVSDPVKVEYNHEPNGKISIKVGVLSVAPTIAAHTKLEYDSYICHVRGSGEGSRRAIWDFDEDRNLKLGIGLSQALAMTVPSAHAVRGELNVSASLARNGVIGAVRDMVLGKSRPEDTFNFMVYEPD